MTTKHLNTVATRIQSRLSRQGVKVALGDIKDYLKINVANVESITDVEVNTATEHFMNTATQLTVIDSSDVASIDNVNPPSIQNNETGSNQDEIRGNQNNQETLVTSNDLHLNEAAQHTQTVPQTGELATTEKSELVSTTAENMGIVLDAGEISLIAENINHSSDDFDNDIDTIRSAIIAFVEHKALVNQTKIDTMINEVRGVVGAKNQENSQRLTDGLRDINSDIQQANSDFKSSVKKALTAFDIPTLKAG